MKKKIRNLAKGISLKTVLSKPDLCDIICREAYPDCLAGLSVKFV